jgi:hypothetical protein
MSTAEFSTIFAAEPTAGPLEVRHLRSRNYRNAADTSRLTSTHWHIAWANGLGWGFDGMDGARRPTEVCATIGGAGMILAGASFAAGRAVLLKPRGEEARKARYLLHS